MKKLFAATALLAALLASPSHAANSAEEGFGIGIVLGTPSGVTGALPIGAHNAINAVVGYDLRGDANLFLQGDYVWIQPGIIPVESGRVNLYYGPGAFARLAKSGFAGIRAVVGLDYRLEATPLQVFFEIGPGINVLPDTDANVGAGLGARFYF